MRAVIAVNGQWGSWTEWGSCTLSCGGGTRLRKRSCDSPSPSDNGRYCAGSDRQVDYCNRDDCPVHGNWALWSSWGDCTVTCGRGQRRRFRTCTNPRPRFHGRACVGLEHDTQLCNTNNCAGKVDRRWPRPLSRLVNNWTYMKLYIKPKTATTVSQNLYFCIVLVLKLHCTIVNTCTVKLERLEHIKQVQASPPSRLLATAF